MSAAGELRVRVAVTDVWDTVRLTASSEWSVAELKSRALAAATGRRCEPSAYQVKYRGALVMDEQQSLGSLRAPHDAAFIVLPVHRRPVR